MKLNKMMEISETIEKTKRNLRTANQNTDPQDDKIVPYYNGQKIIRKEEELIIWMRVIVFCILTKKNPVHGRNVSLKTKRRMSVVKNNQTSWSPTGSPRSVFSDKKGSSVSAETPSMTKAEAFTMLDCITLEPLAILWNSTDWNTRRRIWMGDFQSDTLKLNPTFKYLILKAIGFTYRDNNTTYRFTSLQELAFFIEESQKNEPDFIASNYIENEGLFSPFDDQIKLSKEYKYLCFKSEPSFGKASIDGLTFCNLIGGGKFWKEQSHFEHPAQFPSVESRLF